MRIANATINRQVTQELMKYQHEMAELQSKISSGKKLNKPSDNPVYTARQVNLTKQLSQLDQYDRNINIADARLTNEETLLAHSENILLRVRELALIGNNSTTSAEVYPALVTELHHLRDELLSQANATDQDGNFIFAGNKTSTRPFTPGSASTYSGDNQQRVIQVNQTIRMATGDSGQDVFMQAPASDVSHSVQSGESNAGEATIVLNSGDLDISSQSSRFELRFPSPDTYSIVNLDTGVTAVPESSLPASNTINFAGIQLSLSGTAAPGDRFILEPTGRQDVFKTLQDFIDVLSNPPTSGAEKAIFRQNVNNVLIQVDSAFDHMTLKRAIVGNRLSSLDAIKQENIDTAYHLKSTLSGVEDLDYAEAISKLQQQATALEALQKTITRTQGLSLFNS